MKIVIATPFYPPETEEMAVYAKELAERLTARHHDIIVVAYARLPEESPGVRMIAVSKRLPLFFRLALYTVLLFHAVKKADALYAQNGASVELPAGIVSAMLVSKPLFLYMGDKHAVSRASKSFFLGGIQRFAKNRAHAEIIDTPLERPEVLPFEPPPLAQQAAYQVSWDEHIQKIIKIFNHA